MGLLEWLRKQIGQVPREIEVCEFRCSQISCRHGDWEQCEWRLRGGLPGDLPQQPEEPPASAGESAP